MQTSEEYVRLCAHSLIKAQEEQAISSKSSRQKLKEKPEPIRETQKEKRRMTFGKKVPPGGTAGTIAPLADTDQNNLGMQSSQEKFVR